MSEKEMFSEFTDGTYPSRCKLTMERVDTDPRGLKIVGHLLRVKINNSKYFYFDKGLIRHMQLLLGTEKDMK